MGKLIAVVGNTGVGKTTLVRALCAASGFDSGLEQHAARPFQARFKQDKRYALPNQVDYLVLRAEQERALRARDGTALIDGGLEQDFHGFTELFHARGYLSDDEFEVCRRLYNILRGDRPLPELIVHLTASEDAVRSRLAGRDRINVAATEDLALLAALLAEWIATLEPVRVLHLDVSSEDVEYRTSIARVLERLDTHR